MTAVPQSPEYLHVTVFMPTGITHFKSKSHPWKLAKQFIHTWISHGHGGNHFILSFIPIAHDRICHWRIQPSDTASTCALAMASAWSWGQSASPILTTPAETPVSYDHPTTTSRRPSIKWLRPSGTLEFVVWDRLQTSSYRRALCIPEI